jgi:hypothetical protein
MARKPMSADALWKDKGHLAEAIAGESALACALIAGAAVENALITLLTNCFIEGSTTAKKIFEQGRKSSNKAARSIRPRNLQTLRIV